MKKLYVIFVLIFCLFLNTSYVSAYWLWTKDNKEWENPKYAAKDTPSEQLAYALTFYESKNSKGALREFKKILKYYPLSKEASSAQYYIGRVMEDLGKFYEAFKAYQKVIDKYPYTELVDEVIEREFKIGKLFFSGKKIRVLGVVKVPAKDKAIEIFKIVVDNAPYGKYAEESIFNTGMIYKEIADYDNAILTFKDLIDKYPKSDLFTKAKYELAKCTKYLSLESDYDQSPTSLARKEFEDFVKDYPDAPMSQDVKEIIDKLRNKEAKNAYNIAKFYEERKELKSAVIYYEEVIDEYYDTEWADKAKERLNALQKN